MIYRILIAVGVALLGAPLANADFNNPPPNPYAMTEEWSGPDNQFVTCAIEDSTGWWWGTDNDGLWRYMPNGPLGARWMHVRAQDGLYDDSITSLCYDRLGRLWVGTERRGVSVYNGSWWQNYDEMTGPLGVHVNAMAIDPATGDVWIGSEEGLAVYSESKKSWRYLTRGDGLVSDKITCLAFTKDGQLVVGTASDGLMIGIPSTDALQWRHVVASPDASLTQVGRGLPGDQINCLLVNGAGKIFCGTSFGLGESTDNGVTWSYQHGWQWPKYIPILENATHAGTRSYVQIPLAEQFISCLGYDKAGHLYIGHRQRGFEIYDDARNVQIYHTPFDAHGVYLKAVVPTRAGGVLVAHYGEGLTLLGCDQIKSVAEQDTFPQLASKKLPPFPTPAPPPASGQLRAMAAHIAALGADYGPALGYYLGEDWMTQGDWVGHYGADLAVLCAEDGNTDLIPNAKPGYSVSVSLGRSLHDGEDVSHWLYWSSTSDPRVLYDPARGTRRQAEWNDHGERYWGNGWDRDSVVYYGPDLWLPIEVPAGEQRVSLYFMNKDGHTADTRLRDYIVNLRQFVPGVPIARAYDMLGALRIIAQTRVSNFWPGVYESFVVTGPGKYYLQIEKNCSLNTILQGVFVDSLGSDAPVQQPAWMHGVRYSPDLYAIATPAKPAAVTAKRLWGALDSVYGNSSGAGVQREYRILLLRAASAGKAPPDLLAKWRWSLGFWTDADWTKFNDFTNQLKAALPEAKKP